MNLEGLLQDVASAVGRTVQRYAFMVALGSAYCGSGAVQPGENEPCTPESGCSYERVCVDEVCVNPEERKYTCEEGADMFYDCYIGMYHRQPPEERSFSEQLMINKCYELIREDCPEIPQGFFECMSVICSRGEPDYFKVEEDIDRCVDRYYDLDHCGSS